MAILRPYMKQGGTISNNQDDSQDLVHKAELLLAIGGELQHLEQVAQNVAVRKHYLMQMRKGCQENQPALAREALHQLSKTPTMTT